MAPGAAEREQAEEREERASQVQRRHGADESRVRTAENRLGGCSGKGKAWNSGALKTMTGQWGGDPVLADSDF